MGDKQIETIARSEWEADPRLREEFDNDFSVYLAWREADYKGLIKTLNN